MQKVGGYNRMTALRDIIAYILKNYPLKEDLSNARVTKMIYLADWHQALYHHRQMTNIAWKFDNYGPFVPDIKNTIEDNQDIFNIKHTHNYYGTSKSLFSLKENDYEPVINSIEKDSIDYIIKVTNPLIWNDFIKLVYSTYPISSSNRYSLLNLVEKAKEYKSIQ